MQDQTHATISQTAFSHDKKETEASLDYHDYIKYRTAQNFGRQLAIHQSFICQML